jgi:DNA-binding MarR family transcriptional regulator
MSSEPARLPDSMRALHKPIGASRGDDLDELRTTAVRDRDSVGVSPVNTPSSHADSFTPQELTAWRGLREVHARVIHRLDVQMQAVHGQTLSQSEVLILLSDAPGQRMRMTALAEGLLISRSGCTRLVGRLETLGYVTRRAATDDRRGLYAQLTDTGRHVMRPARATYRESVRAAFLDRLRATDQVALGDIWSRVRAGA